MTLSFLACGSAPFCPVKARAAAPLSKEQLPLGANLEAKANQWWEESQKLNPDSWNFHRQDWSFTKSEATAKWIQKVGKLNGKPYYRPLDLPVAE